MDYTHTAYEDYIVPSRMGRLDNFANDESMVRAGFGYRFGAAQARSSEPNFAANSNGPYVGANFGHGAIATRLQGPREEGGAGGALDADYADDGVTGGAFAGYGQTFGAFFIAAEVEAELSDHNFDLDRQGGGRQVQLEKQDSYGAALRLGLVVQQAALVYARLGAVATEFQIDYTTGGLRLAGHQRRRRERHSSRLGQRLPAADRRRRQPGPAERGRRADRRDSAAGGGVQPAEHRALS